MSVARPSAFPLRGWPRRRPPWKRRKRRPQRNKPASKKLKDRGTPAARQEGTGLAALARRRKGWSAAAVAVWQLICDYKGPVYEPEILIHPSTCHWIAG